MGSSSSISSVIEEGKRVLEALQMHLPEVRVRGISTADLLTIVQDLELSDASVRQTKTTLVNQRSTRNEHKSAAHKAMRYLKGHIRNEFNPGDPVYQTVFGKSTPSRASKTSKSRSLKVSEASSILADNAISAE